MSSVGRDGEGLGDLEQVPLRHGQGLDAVAEVRREADAVEQLARDLGGGGPSAKTSAGRATWRFSSDGHVGQHGRVLVDDRDAERGRRPRGAGR